MEYVVFDVETDSLDYTKIHCIAVRYKEEKESKLFTKVSDFETWADRYYSSDMIWVAHNGCGFDYWVINELTNVHIARNKICDTSVMSKTLDYGRHQTHSLAELGQSIGLPKMEYTGGFEEYTPEMGKYCKRDVDVCFEWFKKHGKDFDKKYMQVEHEMALINAEIQRNGFRFNKTKAQNLLVSVKSEMSDLELEMQKAFPPQLVEDRRIQWRVKSDGVPYATCLKAQSDAPKWEVEGDELVLYKWKDFSPASPKDRIDVLWDAGWKPYDKTKGHIAHERSKKLWR